MLSREKKYCGFTLIEVMVAVSIFVVVAMIVSGAMITAQRISQKSRAIKLVMDNLNFALDSMALKMRGGGNYECLGSRFTGVPPPSRYPVPSECANNGGEGIFFEGLEEKKQFIYQISVNGKSIEYWEEGMDVDVFMVITRSDLEIGHLRFYVFNDQTTPPSAPRVLVTLYGQTTVGGDVTRFGVQTTAAERL